MRLKTTICIFLFILPGLSWAALDCDPGRTSVIIYAGINPTAADLPPRMGMAGAENADLKSVRFQWLPEAPEERVNSSESAAFNYLTQTMNWIKIRNGSTGVTTTDIAEAALLPSSDLPDGQIDVEVCMPDNIDKGLVFAIYHVDGVNVGFQTTAVKVIDGIATTVANEGLTDKVGLEFNETGADQILQNISLATNTSLDDLDRVIAENIYQETLILQFEQELATMNMMHKPNDGMVFGNNFVVTGSNAQAYVPHGVESVFDGGSNVLSSGRVHSIDNRIDSTEDVGALTMRVMGYPDRTVMILEGRADLDTNTPECTDGSATITASFSRDSTMESVMELWKNGVLQLTEYDGSLNESVTCDGTYEVRGYRVIERHVVDEDSATFDLNEGGQQVSIEGLSVNGTYYQNSGGTVGDVAIRCDRLMDGHFEPTGVGTYSGGALSWMTVDADGNLGGTPTGNDCDQSHEVSYTLTGPDDTATANVNWVVGAAVEPSEILGLDYGPAFDGTIDDYVINGRFDSVLAIEGGAPGPFKAQIIAAPEGRQFVFGEVGDVIGYSVNGVGEIAIQFPACTQGETDTPYTAQVQGASVDGNTPIVTHRDCK